MSQIKAVIFDMDGCLVDSEVHALEILAAELRDAGVEDVTVEDLRARFLGVAVTRICEYFEDQRDLPLPAGFIDRFEERLFARYRRDLKLIDGIPDLLRSLADRGVATAIASGSSARRLKVTLECVDLSSHFRGRCFSADLVENGKPAPDLFLYAAEQLGIAPVSCAVLEDSPHGVTGARAAGMRAIGFVGGSHLADFRDGHARRLEQAGAATVRRDMTAMLDALLTAAAQNEVS